MLDKNPFQITEFKGLNRGTVDPHFLTRHNDQIPFSNAVDAANLVFTKEGGIRTRPGVKVRTPLELTLAGDGGISLTVVPMMHWRINRLLTTDYVNRWLILEWNESSGTLFDLYSGTATAILTLTGMKYASVINIFGRIYISPLSDFGVPLANSSIYVYDGTGAPPAARTAAGTKPTAGTLAVAENTNASAFCSLGLHLCAVAYETDSGFITRPNATWLQVTVTVEPGKSIKFTNIPLGPAGTVARHLLVTRTIIDYDGNQENYELFFGLRIGDNTTTTGEVILPDSGLVDSADYLLNIYETVPSCSTISVLGGRLMYNGIRLDKRVVLVSQVADPETISESEDYLQIYDAIPADINTGKELRGQYYIFKESSTYVTNDNGGPPNTWSIELVDSGMGAAPFGIADVMANPGSLVLDNLLVANLSGIYAFSGTFLPIPIGRNLQAVFNQDLPRAESKYTRMTIDPVNRICYLLIGKPIEAIPPDPENITGGCTLYMGDYYNGIDVENIKWMKWNPRLTLALSPLPPGLLSGQVSHLGGEAPAPKFQVYNVAESTLLTELEVTTYAFKTVSSIAGFTIDPYTAGTYHVRVNAAGSNYISPFMEVIVSGQTDILLFYTIDPNATTPPAGYGWFEGVITWHATLAHTGVLQIYNEAEDTLIGAVDIDHNWQLAIPNPNTLTSYYQFYGLTPATYHVRIVLDEGPTTYPFQAVIISANVKTALNFNLA